MAGLLFTVVLALRLVEGNPLDAISVLYIFPVSLVAMSKGRRAGLLAGVMALALIGIWVLIGSVDLSTIGWLSRALPLLLVGGLIGSARDKIHRAAEQRAGYTLAVQRHREAVEINDTLVQGMSAAKWSFESGRTESGLKILGETVELGHRLVSEMIREAGTAGRSMSSPVQNTPVEKSNASPANQPD